MRAEEAEGVMAVYLAYYRGDLVECWLGGGVEDTGADPCHVGGDAVHAVGVDAAKVGGDEALRYDGSVGFWDAISDEDGGDEGFGGRGGYVVFLFGGGRGVHGRNIDDKKETIVSGSCQDQIQAVNNRREEDKK
jgi:hypothetical protein